MADILVPEPPSRRWRVAVVAGTLVLAAGGVALGLTLGGSTSGYRTVAARDGTVDKTVTVTGSVEPVNRVTLSFGVEGIVATVAVHVGERVAAGQTLATLRTTALSRQVIEDTADLRAAQAAITADETDQADGGGAGGTGSTGSGSTSGGAGGAPGSTSGGKSAGTSPGTLHAAQQAVVNAQKTADAAEQTAAQALAAADTACGTTSTGSGTAAAKGSTTTTTTTTTQPPHGSASGTACATALHDALVDQQALATDQRAVTTAETALAKVLSEEKTATGTTGGTVPPSTRTTTPSTSPSTGATGATGTGAIPVGSATTSKSQAAQLADDQATVDSDDATLLTAQQSLAEADLTSPIAGTVGAVGVAAGQAAGSGSETAAFTILTQHAFEAEGLVSPTQVPQLATGDTVRVTVDGRPSTITGRVTRVGPVNTALGFQYPVVVALPGGTSGLFTGSLCQMTVVERVVRHTLAVPTSAVHTKHGRSTVTVLRNGKAVSVQVGVGIVGMDETQILDGLHPGEDVVLADLTRPLPKPPSVSGHSRTEIPVPGGRFFIVGNGGSGYVSYAPLVRPTG